MGEWRQARVGSGAEMRMALCRKEVVLSRRRVTWRAGVWSRNGAKFWRSSKLHEGRLDLEGNRSHCMFLNMASKWKITYVLRRCICQRGSAWITCGRQQCGDCSSFPSCFSHSIPVVHVATMGMGRKGNYLIMFYYPNIIPWGKHWGWREFRENWCPLRNLGPELHKFTHWTRGEAAFILQSSITHRGSRIIWKWLASYSCQWRARQAAMWSFNWTMEAWMWKCRPSKSGRKMQMQRELRQLVFLWQRSPTPGTGFALIWGPGSQCCLGWHLENTNGKDKPSGAISQFSTHLHFFWHILWDSRPIWLSF